MDEPAEWVPAEIREHALDFSIRNQILPENDPEFNPRASVIIDLEPVRPPPGFAPAPLVEPAPALECDIWYPEVDQFLDQNAVLDYTCLICLELAKEPVVHEPYDSCKALFCLNCANNMAIHRPQMPCPGGCNRAFIPQALPLYSHHPNLPDKCQRGQLKVRCAVCPVTLKFKQYRKHFLKRHWAPLPPAGHNDNPILID